MSVGAGKTALAVAACLRFARRRALIVTPSNVIRGTFRTAFDLKDERNALYGLPGGPILVGHPPPRVLFLDGEDGPIRRCPRRALLAADIIVGNFQSLGESERAGSLLAKLHADEIDLIVIDEAHMAAARSYQSLLKHFAGARSILMSACFKRLDGKPIGGDLIFRYRLLDAVTDGHAKRLTVHRFAAQPELTRYCVSTTGRAQEAIGRDEILALLQDERLLDRVTVASEVPMPTVCAFVRTLLTRQARLLRPVKPRVLFSALGLAHACQLAAIATQEGVPCEFVTTQ